MTDEPYIIMADQQQREDYAISQIVDNPLLLSALTEPLGLGELSWYVQGLDIQWTGKKPGDIDILGGRIAWRNPSDLDATNVRMQQEYPDRHPYWQAELATRSLAQGGGIAWPPSMDWLVGVEVKCAYVIDGVAKSTKASPQKVSGIRDQIDGLLGLGLDRVALLDIIATTPAYGQDGQAWFAAIAKATTALDTVRDVVDARLEENNVAGQFVWPVGAVVGGSESERGAGIPQMLRAPRDNPRPYDLQVQDRRDHLAERVLQMLRLLRPPKVFPVVLVFCKACKAIHGRRDNCATGSCGERS